MFNLFKRKPHENTQRNQAGQKIITKSAIEMSEEITNELTPEEIEEIIRGQVEKRKKKK